MKKFFLVLFTIIILSSCGFNSIYTQDENINFEILSLKTTGDKDINYLIEKELKKYIGKNNVRKFQVKINTTYSKNPIVKDKTGKITKYKLIANLDLEFKLDNKMQNISLNEVFNMENFNDKFEEKKYEDQIKNNLSKIMLNKIIPYLTNYE